MEAIDKLQKVENLEQSSLGVRGAVLSIRKLDLCFNFLMFKISFRKRVLIRNVFWEFIVVAAVFLLVSIYSWGK